MNDVFYFYPIYCIEKNPDLVMSKINPLRKDAGIDTTVQIGNNGRLFTIANGKPLTKKKEQDYEWDIMYERTLEASNRLNLSRGRSRRIDAS